MNRTKKFLLITVVILVLALAGHLYYLTTLAATESYPADSYLSSEPLKKALIIVAHDDDMVGSAGTISLLCAGGWNIREMCFYQSGGLYKVKDSLKNPVRKRDLQTVASLQGLAGIDPVDFNFRNDMEQEKAYMPMPYSSFATNYKEDPMTAIIGAYIEKYKPTVIFTLDDSIGGYGNPDHVLVSRLVLDYCRNHKYDPGFTVRKIYQPVFPPSLADRVLGSMPVYIEAKLVYQCRGMPLPNVQVDISSVGAKKKQAMKAYTTEQNSLKQIWPWYNWYPGRIYFSIFDRDFFRVVDI